MKIALLQIETGGCVDDLPWLVVDEGKRRSQDLVPLDDGSQAPP